MKYTKDETDALLGLIILLRGNERFNKTHTKKSIKQTQALYHVFNKNMYPSSEFRYDLSLLFDYKPRSIQIWFQNKRQAYNKALGKSVRKMFYHKRPVDMNDVLEYFVN